MRTTFPFWILLTVLEVEVDLVIGSGTIKGRVGFLHSFMVSEVTTVVPIIVITRRSVEHGTRALTVLG